MSQRARFALITLVFLASTGLPAVASAQSIHEFTGADGAAPVGDLVQGRDGLLYGWTSAGGTFNRGTLFRVAADGTGFQTLYSFGQGSLLDDGAVPQKGGLLEVAPGLFYGTTFEGGLNGRGALFTLDVSGAVPVVTTLHSFATTEPGPDGGVIRSRSDGLLYGTTSGAGWGDFGTIYRVGADGSGFSVLYRFVGVDGEAPTGLIEGSDGWLYGTTRRGGTANAGVVFRALRDGSGAIEVLAHLEGSPVAGLTEVLTQDGGGRYLYGVEVGGGPTPFGSIFRLRLDGTGFQRTATVSGGSDGAYPRSRLILGRDGVLYGTASSSGGGCGIDICGSVFRVLPTGQPYTIRAFTLANGASPDGALVQGTDGHLYGTTREGGDAGTSSGVVFVVRDPTTVPLRFTGPLTVTEGQAVTYDVTLDNTVGARLPGPFTVHLTISAGLQFVSASTATDWSCATSAAGLTCQWPFDLDAGAATPTNRLTFMPTPPFSTACGIGPSPCISVRAELRAAGVSVLAAGPVWPLDGGTPNVAPQPADDVVGVAGQIPATVHVLANDTDPDGDPLTVVEIMTPPALGDAVINPDGSITYQAFESLTQNDSFRYRVGDGRGSTATALVTVEPRVPALRTSKLVIDVGPLAVGRVAGGRTTAFSDYALSGRIRLEGLTPRELADFLVGTTYDPAHAVSDPTEFHGAFWQADTIGSMVTIYFRPTVAGRVSVARAVLTTDMPGLAPVTSSLIIVGAGADPATAPVRATDDTFTIPMNTPTTIDVLANDGTESGGTRPLYGAAWGACGAVIGLEPPPGWAPCADGIGGSVTGPPSIQGSQLITVSPPSGATGVMTFAYASAELDACFGPPRAEGACHLESTMYFAAVTVNVVAPDQADLGVSITATPGAVALGDAVTLTVTVTNAGPDTARAVTLTGLGLLSTSHTIERVTPSLGSCAPDVTAGLVCDLGDLGANQSATVEVVARATTQVFDGVTEPQVGVLLSAQVASASDDPDPANNARFTSYVVRRPQSDLDVSVTATPGAVALGDAVTVTVTVTNAGPDTARAVMFTGLGLLGVHHAIERATPSRGLCFSYTAASGLVCALGDLAAGQSATVEVIARSTAQVFEGITEPQVGVLLSASVASETIDPDPANNSRFTSYVVRRPQADLGVSVTATPGQVTLGGAVTVTVTVANAGPDSAGAVMFTGLGLLGVHHDIERATPSRGLCFSYTAASGLVCALGDLAAGQSATVEVVARPTAQLFDGITEPQVSVLLSANVASDTDDPDHANNARANAYVVRLPRADLRLVSAAFINGLNLVSEIRAGETVNYAIGLTNAGDAAGTFTVTTQLPVGLTFAGNDHPLCTAAAQVVTCSALLDPGVTTQAIPIPVLAGVDFMPRGQYSATVVVTSTLESVADPAFRTASASITVRRPGFGLLAAEFATPAGTTLTDANVGDIVDFRVGAANVGDAAGTFTVSTTLPAGVIFQPSPLSQLCTAANLTVTCTVTAPAGFSGVLSLLRLQVAAALVPVGQMSAPFTLQATLDPAESPAVTTASATLTVHVVPVPQPRFRLVAAEFATPAGTTLTDANVGDIVDFRVGAANVGDAAGTFTVSTTLPAGVIFQLSPLSQLCTAANLTVTCTVTAPAGFSGVLSLVRLQVAAVMATAGQMSAPFTLQATLDPAESPALATASATLTVRANTPAGTGVTVRLTTSTAAPTPVTVTFSSVTRGGQTTAEPMTTSPPVPPEFRVASLVYDITTTAAYSAPVTVCIDGSFGASDFLLHYESGAWVQLPNQQRLPSAGPFTRVCATTISLSPFVVGTRVSRFAFEGFFWPVRNPPALNKMKAGSAIPLRFSLGGAYGLNVLSPGFPQVARVGCGTGLPESEVAETDSAIRSGLVYNPFSERYIYVWKTRPEMAGACWQLTLQFTDGTTASALFKMRK